AAPFRRPAARIGKREAAAEDRAGPGRRRDQVVATLGVAGELTAPGCDLPEAVRAARLDPRRRAQRDPRVAVALGLLQAEAPVVWLPSREHRGSDVQRCIDLDRDRSNRRTRVPRSSVDAPLETGEGADQVAPRPRETAI